MSDQPFMRPPTKKTWTSAQKAFLVCLALSSVLARSSAPLALIPLIVGIVILAGSI